MFATMGVYFMAPPPPPEELLLGRRLPGLVLVPIAGAGGGVVDFPGPECRRLFVVVVEEEGAPPPPKMMGLVVVAEAEKDTKQ